MKYRVTLNDRVYEVEVELAEAMLLSEYQTIAPATVSAAAPVEAPAAAAAPVAAPVVAGAGDAIVAPMPGTILKVNVNNGDSVQEGQVLVVLEAMKMENEILAPKAGKVTQVVASRGSSVDTGAPLVYIG